MRQVTVYVDESPSSLGDAATADDLIDYLQNLSDHLAERFPDRASRAGT
jgi:hypothetical protein